MKILKALCSIISASIFYVFILNIDVPSLLNKLSKVKEKTNQWTVQS